MKFFKAILTIAALCAVSTTMPMSYAARSAAVGMDPFKYSVATGTLQQYVRDNADLFMEQLTSSNQIRSALGAILMEAMRLGIPKDSIEDDIMDSLAVLNIGVSSDPLVRKMLALMIFKTPELR
jgi:hypothetical protein